MNTSIIICAENTWLSLGFQITTLPIIAALAGRLAAIAVKLNGVIAYTNPSRGLYSKRFHISDVDVGWSPYICVMNSTLKRKKSISSHEASISAWCTFLDCAIIVAAFILALYGPAINSAAFKKIAARCSQAIFAQAVLDSNAFAIAFSTCDFSAR